MHVLWEPRKQPVMFVNSAIYQENLAHNAVKVSCCVSRILVINL